MEVSVEFDFDITCAECGQTLSANTQNYDERRGDMILTINPCKNCLNKKYDEGYSDGGGGN
jgi:C4-type Zn-finger protein